MAIIVANSYCNYEGGFVNKIDKIALKYKECVYVAKTAMRTHLPSKYTTLV